MRVDLDKYLETGVVSEDVEVTGNYELRGLIKGNVTVKPGSKFNNNGTVAGSVRVEGGYCEINGTVEGEIHNLGGELMIAGTVGGEITGEAQIRDNAILYFERD